MRLAPGFGLTVLLTVWTGALLIAAACWLLNWPPLLRQWILTDLRPWFVDQWERIGVLGVAVSALAAFYLMLAVHEFGHAVVGMCLGFRLRSYRLGPLEVSRPFRLSLYRGPGAFVQGKVESVPTVSDRLPWRRAATYYAIPASLFEKLKQTIMFRLDDWASVDAEFEPADLISYYQSQRRKLTAEQLKAVEAKG
jgi:hypothetical protein